MNIRRLWQWRDKRCPTCQRSATGAAQAIPVASCQNVTISNSVVGPHDLWCTMHERIERAGVV